jgi:hypothetical protein
MGIYFFFVLLVFYEFFCFGKTNMYYCCNESKITIKKSLEEEIMSF